MKKRKDLFSVLEKQEAAAKPRAVPSSFLSRVANGQVRRTITLPGDYVAELKLYRQTDYYETAIEERYKKALVNVKVRTGETSVLWDPLQKFISEADELFDESEPVYYSDKIKFK